MHFVGKLNKEIFRCIKSDEELDDRASSELYNIRRHIVDAENKIKDKLDGHIGIIYLDSGDYVEIKK